MPTFDPTEEETEIETTTTKLHGLDGKPWCSFRAGSLVCVNGDRCLNKNHRKT